MPDSFTTTSHTSLGNRLGGALKGIIVGLILIVGSFGLVYWNEGRVDLSSIAKTAAQIDGTVAPDPVNHRKLVAVSGSLKADRRIADDQFYLKAGNHLAIKRQAEMYAWVENKKTETTNNTGGSETAQTTYSYDLSWTTEPKDSSKFQYPEGHVNPSFNYPSSENRVGKITVGTYTADAKNLDLPSFQAVTLTDENVMPGKDIKRVNGTYLFRSANGASTIEQPLLGDIRLSFQAVPISEHATLFGEQNGTTVSTFADAENNTLFRLFDGSFTEAVSTLRTEYLTSLWLLRLLGLMMMWIGLSLLFSPVVTLLDILPIAGSIGRGAVAIITFIVAFVVTLATIIISSVLHSLIATIIVAVVVALASLSFLPRILKKKPTTG